MATTNSIIDQTFGVDTVEIDSDKRVTIVPEQLPCSLGAFDSEMNVINPSGEYQFAQMNLKDSIGIGLSAAAELQAVAKQTQSARDYEVLATMLNTVVMANEKLIDLQIKTQKIINNNLSDTTDAPTNVTNNTFIGTTADLLEQIRKAKSDAAKVIEVEYESKTST